MSVIIPSVKEIGLETSKRKPVLKHILFKIADIEFSLLNMNRAEKMRAI